MSDITHDTAAGAYDFGDDDNIPLPDDPAFDAWVAKLAPAVNVPPVTPRMEMWDAIQKAQASAVPTPPPVVRITSRRRTRWIWPTAIAAALLLGVGIDRYMLSSKSVQVATGAARTTPPALSQTYADSTPTRLYRVAAVQTLTQAEALLTAYRSTDMAAKMAHGVPQANGEIAIEPLMDVANVASAVVYMASLTLDANVQFMTVMATKMPFVGRG